MAPHTTPPSGNRRHLTSANAGAFIQQSAASFLPRTPKAPGDCHLQHVVRGANLNIEGREQSRDLLSSCAPSMSGMATTTLENQTPAHAATRLHGATR